jgi:hypothetical protein
LRQYVEPAAVRWSILFTLQNLTGTSQVPLSLIARADEVID